MKTRYFLFFLLFTFFSIRCDISEISEPSVKITGCRSIEVDGHNMSDVPRGAISFDQYGSDSKGSYSYHIEIKWGSDGCIKSAKATRK